MARKIPHRNGSRSDCRPNVARPGFSRQCHPRDDVSPEAESTLFRRVCYPFRSSFERADPKSVNRTPTQLEMHERKERKHKVRLQHSLDKRKAHVWAVPFVNRPSNANDGQMEASIQQGKATAKKTGDDNRYVCVSVSGLCHLTLDPVCVWRLVDRRSRYSTPRRKTYRS